MYFEEGTYGLKALLDSGWSDDLLPEIARRGCHEIELNHAKGWSGKNVDFLVNFPKLRALKIVDLRIANVTAIHCLHDLVSLDVMTYCNTPIHFHEFPLLEKCGLAWRRGAESLFERDSLKELFVNCYKGEDSSPFGRLVKLESPGILSAPFPNLRGLAPLVNLRSLRLGNLRALKSLEGLEGLTRLEDLDVNTCRGIDSVEPLRELSGLRKLNLNNIGEIASLEPLKDLANLNDVAFYELTNVKDGDLSPLMNLKKLSRISFQNRRHYSHKREEFWDAFKDR